MTAKTMVERVRIILGAKNAAAVARETGLGAPLISKILSGTHGGDFHISVLKRVADNTGIPIGVVAEWWAEEESADLSTMVRPRSRLDHPSLESAIDRFWHAKFERKDPKSDGCLPRATMRDNDDWDPDDDDEDNE